MDITTHELVKLVKDISKQFINKGEAEYYAEQIVKSYCRTYPRTNVLEKEVIEDTERINKYINHKPIVKIDLPSLLSVDFNKLPISYHLKWIHDKIFEKASKTGISMFSFVNSGGMHTLTTYISGLSELGMFTIAGFNAGPNAVVPYNGTRGLLGNNPIAYAFPVGNGVQVIDMATSEIPLFDLLNAKRDGSKLRANSAVDKIGIPTVTPSEAIIGNDTFNLLPIGGSYKGYAINYLIEIMTGALVSSKLSNEMDPSYINEEHGGFIICIDIKSLTNTRTFKSQVSAFNKTVRHQKGVNGKKVIVPGDNKLNTFNSRIKSGVVEVNSDVVKKLKKLVS